MRKIFELQAASLPLLISVPHAGTRLPGFMVKSLTPLAATLPDTDWFVDRLYEWVTEIGAGLITADYSRYVVDLNRAPDDAALYRQKTPGLIPAQTFSGAQIYQKNEPDKILISQRLDRYWRPYHQALEMELTRLRRTHGYALLLDAHSIRSHVPLLFEGKLADLNLGSYGGRSAAPSLLETAAKVLGEQSEYSHVIDGRFKGGYITRHYGRPGHNVHALQLEMSQSVYMNEEPPEYHTESANQVRKLLRSLLIQMIKWRPDGA